MEDETNNLLPEESAQPAQHRRGRPRKNSAATEGDTAAKMPARRGRPKKVAPIDDFLTIETSTTAPAAPAQQSGGDSNGGSNNAEPATIAAAAPARAPLFSFDPSDEIDSGDKDGGDNNRDADNNGGGNNGLGGGNNAEILRDARPQLSPEKPPEKISESVYTPDDDNGGEPAATNADDNADSPRHQASDNNGVGGRDNGGDNNADSAESPQTSPDHQPAPQAKFPTTNLTRQSGQSFSGRGERWGKRTTEKFSFNARGDYRPSSAFMGAAGGATNPSGFSPREQREAPAQGKNFNQQRNPDNRPAPRFQPKQKQREKFQPGKFSPQGKFEKIRDSQDATKPAWGALADKDTSVVSALEIGNSFDYNKLKDADFLADLEKKARHVVKLVKVEEEVATTVASTEATPATVATTMADSTTNPASTTVATPATVATTVPRFELRECEPGAVLDFNEIYKKPLADVVALAGEFGIPVFRNPQRRPLIRKIMNAAFEAARPIALAGTLEILANGNGLLLYPEDSFSVRELSAYVPAILIKKYGLQRGHELSAIVHPPMPGETAPIVVSVTSIMGTPPDEIKNLTPFTELTPYYPTERIMLETTPDFPNNLSMRCVDLLCPIGLGQRGLIVAPPRVGKTVLLQTIANSILKNKPKVKLIVLLVDERPEEVTDFKRNTIGAEVISSTFDETPENHVHVAEMVIERARRMVELGKDVVILLDSITRLARAYNTLMPNGGKILSGGVEAGALAKPKRFFGSARNIEDGGSLTILGTALIDTGSKMDEVIFEEFKGTGNMELDLDRDLANKRIFPAINFERSGTRKEELLYHPDEMQYVYSMRRAMKGVPSLEAMEMLINRMKKTKTNIEFLMTLTNRV